MEFHSESNSEKSYLLVLLRMHAHAQEKSRETELCHFITCLRCNFLTTCRSRTLSTVCSEEPFGCAAAPPALIR
uniref:Uncharacterized protein n=1 Tax=Arundo donax TaxID=35708 RepID=A0A0A8YZA4_ARUDO